MDKKIAPPGTWHSDVSPKHVAGKAPKISEPKIDQNRIFWLQSIPEEKGRISIMMYANDQIQSVLPRPLSAKSKVHEYGGGSYLVDKNKIYFVLADDQQIYTFDLTTPNIQPEALTQSPDFRFADLQLDRINRRIIAVCEDHSTTGINNQHEPENYLVSVSLEKSGEIILLHQGYDFYSFPRINPNGNLLCWTCWNHPNMPWDNTELWLAELKRDGDIVSPKKILGNAMKVFSNLTGRQTMNSISFLIEIIGGISIGGLRTN